MIFVTVGTQLPFDRMVSGVADWHARNPDIRVFGQIGKSALAPPFPCVDYLHGAAFDMQLRGADLVVSHAGIGIVLTCWSLKKPLIIMPRRHCLGEHRSDHQFATVRHMSNIISLSTAEGVDDLHDLLGVPWHNHIPCRGPDSGSARISNFVNDLLVGKEA